MRTLSTIVAIQRFTTIVDKPRHWLAHKLGWNHGTIETWWQGEDLMVGFRCNGCGTLEGTDKTGITTTVLGLGIAPGGKGTSGKIKIKNPQKS